MPWLSWYLRARVYKAEIKMKKKNGLFLGILRICFRPVQVTERIQFTKVELRHPLPH